MSHPDQLRLDPGAAVIAVMARPLLPGAAKTRLAADIGATEALAVYARLLAGTLAQAEALEGVALVLAAADGSGAPQPQGASAGPISGRDRRWQVIAQRGRGLGERLANVFEDLFRAGAGTVVVVNSDSPAIPEQYLRQALDLSSADRGGGAGARSDGRPRRVAGRLVLGPAADGGYYLIGCTDVTWVGHDRLLTDLLRRSPMSTPALLSFTLREARAAGMEVAQLPLWVDIDDAADLPLFERLTGEQPLRGDPSRGLREVYLHLTHRCARDCRHCYDKGVPPEPDELTTEEWIDAIDQCVALGATSFVIIGGDPLLRSDFVTLVEHLTGRHGADVRFFFNSLIDEAGARELARAGHSRLRPLVSIDGPRRVNDELRGPGDYDDAMASIANLRAAGLDPVANTVLVRPALPGLPRLARELHAAGIRRLHLILPHQRGGAGGPGGEADAQRAPTPGGHVGGPDGADGLIPSGEELLAAVRKLLDAAAVTGLTIDNLPSWRRRLAARNDFCAAGCRDLAIDPHGRVHACVITAGDPAFVAGSLRDEPLGTIWRESASLRLLRAARSRDRVECAACPVADACGGECWVQAHYAARAHDEPAGYRAAFPYCGLVRPMLEELAAAACTAGAGVADGGQSAAGVADYALFDCI